MDAGEELDKRRLADPVSPTIAWISPSCESQIDRFEGMRRAKPFIELPQRENRLSRHFGCVCLSRS